MLYNVLPFNPEYTTFIAMGLGFVITFLLMEFAAKYLPKDGGRAFAVEGEKSAGKPRGAGLYFIAVFAFVSALFSPMNTEYGFYLVLILGRVFKGGTRSRCGDPCCNRILGQQFIRDYAVAIR